MLPVNTFSVPLNLNSAVFPEAPEEEGTHFQERSQNPVIVCARPSTSYCQLHPYTSSLPICLLLSVSSLPLHLVIMVQAEALCKVCPLGMPAATQMSGATSGSQWDTDRRAQLGTLGGGLEYPSILGKARELTWRSGGGNGWSARRI